MIITQLNTKRVKDVKIRPGDLIYLATDFKEVIYILDVGDKAHGVFFGECAVSHSNTFAIIFFHLTMNRKDYYLVDKDGKWPSIFLTLISTNNDPSFNTI